MKVRLKSLTTFYLIMYVNRRRSLLRDAIEALDTGKGLYRLVRDGRTFFVGGYGLEGNTNLFLALGLIKEKSPEELERLGFDATAIHPYATSKRRVYERVNEKAWEMFKQYVESQGGNRVEIDTDRLKPLLRQRQE